MISHSLSSNDKDASWYRHQHNGSPKVTDFVPLTELEGDEDRRDIPVQVMNASKSKNGVGYRPVGSDEGVQDPTAAASSTSEVEITSTTAATNQPEQQQRLSLIQQDPDDNDQDDEHDNDSSSAASALSDAPTRISAFDACMHLIKGNLGPGCLNIPHAFVLSGWLLGLILFGVVVFQGIYSMYILVYCKQRLLLQQQQQQQQRQQRSNTPQSNNNNIHTFMDVAFAAFGNPGRILIELFLVVLQTGVCCVFLSLLATNLQAAFPILKTEFCVGIITLALLFVVLLQNLKDLRWLSTIANGFMMTAIFTAAGAAIYELMFPDPNADRPPPIKATSNLASIATFVSSMFFSFEGIGLVLPIENSYVDGEHSNHDNDNNHRSHSRDRRHTTYKQYILTGSMSIVAMLFLIIGITSSLAFTDIESGSITAYLTETFPNNRWYPVCNSLVMVAVFMTFSLQLTPAMEVLDEWFGQGCDPKCFSGSNGDCCHALLLVRRQRRRRRRGAIVPQQVNEQEGGFQDEPMDDEQPLSATTTNDGLLRTGGASTNNPNTEDAANGEQPKRSAMGEMESGLSTTSQTTDNGNAVPSNSPAALMMITDDDDGREVVIAAPPLPLANSCFGRYEWIFRRYMVVFGCAIVVLAVNNLALLMSLFGAVGQTGLALMPCAIHLQLQQQGVAPRKRFLSLVDGCTITFSFVVMVTGVVFSVQEIVANKHDDN